MGKIRGTKLNQKLPVFPRGFDGATGMWRGDGDLTGKNGDLMGTGRSCLNSHHEWAMWPAWVFINLIFTNQPISSNWSVRWPVTVRDSKWLSAETYMDVVYFKLIQNCAVCRLFAHHGIVNLYRVGVYIHLSWVENSLYHRSFDIHHFTSCMHVHITGGHENLLISGMSWNSPCMHVHVHMINIARLSFVHCSYK